MQQTLQTKQAVKAGWSDIIHIYKLENDSFVKLTQLICNTLPKLL